MSWDSLLKTAWSWDAAYLIPALAVIWGLAALGSRTWVGSRWMVAAGEASFAFYLIHKPIMEGMGSQSLRTGQTDLWFVGRVLSMFVVVLAAAFALHYVIERPARNVVN